MAIYFRDEEDNWIDAVHPIGCLYLSVETTSPASLFGGTWEQITKAVIRADYEAQTKTYEGADMHVMSTDEMPAHTHTGRIRGGAEGNLAMFSSKGSYGSTGSGLYGPWFRDGYSGQDTVRADLNTVGGSIAMNMMQRSFNCCVWYRTA